ncbi:MAG: C25 family cysteine peptidase [Calditrichia bacterium]
MKRIPYSFFLLAIIYLPLLAGNNSFYEIEHQDNRSLILQFRFPEPVLSAGEKDSSRVVAEMKGLNSDFAENKPLLPLFSSAVAVPAGKVRWQILEKETRLFRNKSPVIYRSEENQNSSQPSSAVPAYYPQNIIRLQEAGIFRDYRMMGIQVYPLQMVPEGLLFYSSVKVKITFDDKSSPGSGLAAAGEQQVFSSLVLNGSQLPLIQPAVQQNPVPPGASPNAGNPDQQVKLFVNENGIYRISGADLVEAGVNLQEINPQTLRLSNKGNEVAILVSGDQDLIFDEGDYLEFWGERNEKTFKENYPTLYDDPFTDENVYWLSWGGAPGIRMVEESGAIISTNPAQYNRARFYPFTVHLEENNYFERFGVEIVQELLYKKDLWYFDRGLLGITKQTYPINIIYPDSSLANTVQATLSLSGRSAGSHSVMAWLNQRLIGRVNSGWFGEKPLLLSNEVGNPIYGADLKHGENDIELQTMESENDHVLFNWASIQYNRQYKAYQNQIEFTKPSPQSISNPQVNLFQFNISHFTRPDIDIYKKGVSKVVNFQIQVDNSSGTPRYQISFQDRILTDDVQYMALPANQRLKPLRIEREQVFNPENPQLRLRSAANSADYLIITHEKFYERAKEFMEFRRQQGLSVVMVRVQDIYDEFNYGVKSPLAIQKFLKYAFYNWDRTHRLQYVVFLGDANYNPYAKGTLSEDLVPTFFYESMKFGAVATDFPYSQLSGDDELPDIFVGRVPVRSNGELINFINKIKEFELNPQPGPWRNQALFISGNDAGTYEFQPEVYEKFGIARKPAFRTQNQRLMNNLLPHHYSAFKLNTIKDPNLPFDPNYGGTTDLIQYFDEGISFMTFLGHGGGAVWADVGLMNLQDVDRLNNQGKYPVIASMTCFTGRFETPQNKGLMGKLVLAPNKGAIAAFASSGLGYVANDYAILWNVMAQLFTGEVPIGQAMALGKISYLLTSQYVVNDTLIPGNYWGHYNVSKDMIHQYNLIGDPYTSLQLPAEDLSIQVSNEIPQPGDTLQVTVQAPLGAADGYLEFSDANKQVTYREPVTYPGGSAQYLITLPPDMPNGSGFVRAYLTDGSSDAAGYKQVGINYASFDSVQTLPQNPNAEDSVSIQALVRDAQGIQRVYAVAVLPGANVQKDTLHLAMSPQGNDLYRTTAKIPPTFTLETVYFYIYAENNAGQVSRMNYHYQVQEDRPDPFIYKDGIRFTGGETVRLSVGIGNNGTIAAEGVQVKLFLGMQNFQSDSPFATETISIGPKDSTNLIVTFPFNLNQSTYPVYAQLDRSGSSPDFNRNNNVANATVPLHFVNLLPAVGTTFSGTTTDTVPLAGQNRFWLAPGGISKSAALEFHTRSLADSLKQTGLTPVPLAGFLQPQQIEFSIGDSAAQFQGPLVLQLQPLNAFLDSAHISIMDVQLYRWSPHLQTWQQEAAPAVVDSAAGLAEFRLNKTGLFALFYSTDDLPPHIELTVDGRQVRSKSIVSTEPVLNILVEDESGLHISRDQIVVQVDGVELPAEKIFIPDTVQQSKILGISAYPELLQGSHNLLVQVKDVNGNVSEKEFTLEVNEELELHVFGNYPNPFSDVTIFSYYLQSREIVDDLEIRIFTVSGRLIKRIRNDVNTLNPGNDPRRVGYNELTWDGTDDDGVEVANGVYFALFRIKYGDSEKQEILKVAKLK